MCVIDRSRSIDFRISVMCSHVDDTWKAQKWLCTKAANPKDQKRRTLLGFRYTYDVLVIVAGLASQMVPSRYDPWYYGKLFAPLTFYM